MLPKKLNVYIYMHTFCFTVYDADPTLPRRWR